MKYALAILVAALFFFFGRLTVREAAPKVEKVQTSEQARCEELAQFRGDFEEYQKLKTEAERYKKADEILGKMMVIFLADLGLHATRADVAAATASTVALPLNPAKPNLSDTVPVPAVKPDKSEIDAEAAAKIAIQKWRHAERELMNIRYEDDLGAELKKLEIKDLFAELKNQVPLSPQQVEIVGGHYAGQIHFYNNEPTWALEWDLNLRKVKNEWQGTLLLTMAKNGKVFSRSSGTGQNKNFHSLANGQGIMVEVYGGDAFLQVYPLRNFDKLAGLYYEKKELDQFVPTGTVSLQRVR